MTRRQGVWWLASGLVLMFAGCEPPAKREIDLTPNKSGERETVYGHALDRADKSVCEQYVGQLNAAVLVYRQDHEDQNPPDLAAVIKQSGLPASELQNCTYQYDAQTGKVSLAK